MKKLFLLGTIVLLLFATIKCEKEKATEDKVHNKTGIVNYEKNIHKWVIYSTIQTKYYDGRVLFIPCEDTPIPLKYQKSNTRVVFSGNTVRCPLDIDTVMPVGATFMCLKIKSIKKKQKNDKNIFK